MTQKKWKAYFAALKFQAWPEALKVLTEISQEEKDNPRVLMNIGEVYEKLGEQDKAIAFYRHAAFLLNSRGSYNKALLLHKIILRIIPGNELSIKETGELLRKLEEPRSEMPPPISTLKASDIFPDEPGTLPAAEQAPADIVIPVEIPAVPEETRIPEVKKEPTEEELFAEFMGKYNRELSAQELEEFSRPVEEKLSAAGESELFAGIPQAALAITLKEAQTLSFTRGQDVIKEGDLGDSLYIIKSGRARVVSNLFDKEVELAVLTEGEAFGEAGFLTGKPRTASVIAEGPLQVYEIQRGLLEELINLNPSVLSRMEEFYELRVMDTMKKATP